MDDNCSGLVFESNCQVMAAHLGSLSMNPKLIFKVILNFYFKTEHLVLVSNLV